MSKVNYMVLDGSIVLSFQGRVETIKSSDKRYDRALKAIREGNLDQIPEVMTLNEAVKGSGFELRDGKLYDGSTELPAALTERIIKLRDMDLPFDPLLKFWDNLKKNPSFNSRQMLYKFLEHNGHPLTDDGCFIAYRGVREDFKDKHTGEFDNSPGQTLEMPRDQVDDNPNNTCSHGFHVACHDYASSFGEKLVEVKVNPIDVVAVPNDYNGTKMRVCKFEVIQECQQIRKEEIYNNPKSVHDEDTSDCDDDLDEEQDDDLCDNCGEEKSPFTNYCGECGHEF